MKQTCSWRLQSGLVVTTPFDHMFPKQAVLCETWAHVFAFRTNTVFLTTHLAYTHLHFRKSTFERYVCVFGLLSSKRVFLSQEKQMMVYVERRVADDATLSKDEAFGSIRNQLCTFREGETAVSYRISRSKDTNVNAEHDGIILI